MVADMVKHVVGERGEVTSLMGSGVDPHLFKPLPQHVRKMNDADVVFYSGLMLEGRMQDALREADGPKRPVVAVTRHLEQSEKEYLRSPPEFEGHYDPHVWMDVKAWIRCMDQVVETLSAICTDDVETFRQNAKAYAAELEELDLYVHKSIESIPVSHRVLVTAHDAFGYFGRAYGMEVRSVQGVTTESEAGVRDINQLVDFLVESKIPAIFVETSVNEKNMRAVIEGAKSRGARVGVGAELFSDAMGEEGTYEGTYIGMIDHNATRITRALGGNAPEKGFRARLKPETHLSARLNFSCQLCAVIAMLASSSSYIAFLLRFL
jgi:manganese/zinc/iron transport system substrate-binding protein